MTGGTTSKQGEGLPEGWRLREHGTGCTDGQIDVEVLDDGEVQITTSYQSGGSLYVTEHEAYHTLPTAVILWLADRLRPETESAPALTDAVREVGALRALVQDPYDYSHPSDPGSCFWCGSLTRKPHRDGCRWAAVMVGGGK